MPSDLAGRLAVLSAKRQSMMGRTAYKSKLTSAVEAAKSPLEKLIDVLYSAYECEEDHAEGKPSMKETPKKAPESDSD